MVEDHPLDYGSFEGTIPKGEYGGGTVMLWDRGTFRVGGDDPARALREGKLHLYLEGEKLRGEWALVRMRGEDSQWLLLKVGGALKPQRRTWDRSVATGRAMEEIASAPSMPAFVEPMKAKPATVLPRGDDWLYELKFDGYRFLGGKAGREVRLWSRTENDFTPRFPAVAKALATLKAASALVDGELVVPDELGRPSFQLIQNAGASTQVRAFLFDLLELEGEDLRHEPLAERRARPGGLDRQAPRFRLRRWPAQRRVAQDQVSARTGICHRRLHRAEGREIPLRRAAHRLLSRQGTYLCRQGRDGL